MQSRTPPKSRLQTKPFSLSKQSLSPQQLLKQTQQILQKDSAEQLKKYLQQNKITSMMLKNEKCLNILHISKQILNSMLIDGQTHNTNNEQFLIRLIQYYKKNEKKIVEFCRCLQYFGEKDYEFEFILDVAKGFGEGIGFYLRCRDIIVDSFLNKSKKQLLSTIIGQTQQWYKLVQKLFKNIQKQHLVELFTDIIKYHYLTIKKNQNQLLNGAEIFRISQIMHKNIKENHQLYSFDSKDQPYLSLNINGDGSASGEERVSRANKEKEVKRLFEKNVVQGLQAQDRELIRILSYKDNNIGRLLQKKHQKMIQLIAQDVDKMRSSIQEQKNKYIQLWGKKQQILQQVQQLNKLTLKYVQNNNRQNQDILLNEIYNFHHRYKPHWGVEQEIQRIKASSRNRRLIEIIQAEERQRPQ